jgi:hypothetical protein
MSISHETTIWCDYEDCGQWDQATGNAAMVRRDLKKKGWKVNLPGGKDFCPSCAFKATRQPVCTVCGDVGCKEH